MKRKMKKSNKKEVSNSLKSLKSLKFALLLVLLAAVLMLGQRGCQRGAKEKIGTQGLVAEFLPSAPPDQISRGQSFPIYASVENKGNYDVKPGEAKFYLEGILAQSFSLTREQLGQENKLALRGAEEDIVGGKERVIFAEEAAYKGAVVPFDARFFVRSCYTYESEIRADMCFGLEDTEICKLEEKVEGTEKTSAPVQFTALGEERSGKNLLIKFKVENKGKGKVYAPDTNCDSLEAFKEDRVLVSVETSEPVDCIGQLGKETSGEADLNSIVACKRDLEKVSPHISPVNIRVRYKYIEFAEKVVKVTE